MIKKMNKFLKQASRSYIHALKKPIEDNMVLLEAGQGKNLNGSMFAILRELCENKKWEYLQPVFVVTEETIEAARKRFAFYGYEVKLVIRNSKEYCYILATAKYLFTDNSFPPFFDKRAEQVYMNTWHGTPLKTLGKSDIKNAKSLANIQKNYLMSDFALFPNEFTENVFMKDYMLENIYQGKVVLSDYPRNSIFLNKEWAISLRKKLQLEDKQLIAYMPTWRGTDRNADADIQKRILSRYFKEIDQKLNDDQIFYVNLHFLIGNTMDLSEYKHIKAFPKEYETYDFLTICDMLVTDYSSVFFDYAVTQRKIVLFAYDLDEYMRDRGTYFPVESLPFPIVDNTDALVTEINKRESLTNMEQFLHTYCNYCALDIPRKVLELMIYGKKEELHICSAPNNGKENVLVYGGKLKNRQINRNVLKFLTQENRKEKNIIFCFKSNIDKDTVEFLSQLPDGVNYMAVVTNFNFSLLTRIAAFFAIRNKVWEKIFGKKLSEIYNREKNRLYYGINPKQVVYFPGEPQYMYKVFAEFECEKVAHIQHDVVIGIKSKNSAYRNMLKNFQNRYDIVYDHRQDEIRDLWMKDEKNTFYNRCINISNIFNVYYNRKFAMQMKSLVVVKKILPVSLNELKVKIGGSEVSSTVGRGIPLWKNVRLTVLKLTITNEEIKKLEIQNPVTISYDADGYGMEKAIKYNLFHRNKGKNLHGPIRVYKSSETSAYFRQTVANTLYFTVRKWNVTDARIERIKLFCAYYLAKVLPMGKIILLFEKESNRYEESASVLYEKLIDCGYKNAYFIIDKNYSHLDSVPTKYRKNLIYKTTFKHYLYFFKSKTFLGSEALVHAIDLRIINKRALKKLADQNVDYVFLQHGVMYMVSLDSESRKFFKPKKTMGKYRVVVSSEEEARHFIELGDYNPEFLYISGLPKYDKNVLNEDADKIVIMPTWRPWEYNDARYEFFETKYYKMVCRIFEALPKEYREKVVILPHPLFFDAVKDSEFELKKYFDFGSKYDDILKQTKILITDYSSIAYDAFYRGSNVVFYWEEKEECLENYGPSTKLMLNEQNVYGDICLNQDDLSRVIRKNYTEGQKEVYLKRYEYLVQYHDGKNTERLIKMMKRENII